MDERQLKKRFKFPDKRLIIHSFAGAAFLIICYILGGFVSRLIHGFISPAVMGMIILFLLLKAGIARAEWLEKPANFLLDNLILFFIPATVGIALIPFEIIKHDFLAIIVASVLSSLLVLWLVGFIVDKFEKSDK
ncbi:MAG: hypothetical protein ACD_77C00437G0005 [uncultured bacterium]|nr:MAG: hypothetical protein ACD_77C00437G0005 [uncultured bacterium]HBY01811.1 CidA/LrgA family protein [Rikenellaceae bacterium]